MDAAVVYGKDQFVIPSEERGHLIGLAGKGVPKLRAVFGIVTGYYAPMGLGQNLTPDKPNIMNAVTLVFHREICAPHMDQIERFKLAAFGCIWGCKYP